MNIEAMQVFADCINKVGSMGQEAFILYLLEKLIVDVGLLMFFTTVVFLGYRLISRTMFTDNAITKIGNAWDGSGILSRDDVCKIIALIEESKKK